MKMEWKRGEWYLGAKVITFNAGNGVIRRLITSGKTMGNHKAIQQLVVCLQLQAV